jgi:hypothetical protein
MVDSSFGNNPDNRYQEIDKCIFGHHWRCVHALWIGFIKDNRLLLTPVMKQSMWHYQMDQRKQFYNQSTQWSWICGNAQHYCWRQYRCNLFIKESTEWWFTN